MTDKNSQMGGLEQRYMGVGDEGYEVQYLTHKMGISYEQALVLIRLFGSDRRRVEEEAKKLTLYP